MLKKRGRRRRRGKDVKREGQPVCCAVAVVDLLLSSTK